MFLLSPRTVLTGQLVGVCARRPVRPIGGNCLRGRSTNPLHTPLAAGSMTGRSTGELARKKITAGTARPRRPAGGEKRCLQQASSVLELIERLRQAGAPSLSFGMFTGYTFHELGARPLLHVRGLPGHST